MANLKAQDDKSHVINGQQFDHFVDSVSNASEQAMEKSKMAVDKSVGLIKEYPVHATIGAGLVGFFLGSIMTRLSGR